MGSTPGLLSTAGPERLGCGVGGPHGLPCGNFMGAVDHARAFGLSHVSVM